MASPHTSLEENLKCSICFKIFRDPVVLRCSHSFCKACLDRAWYNREVKECPLCRKTSESTPLNNIVLKDACESLVEEQRCRVSVETRGVTCVVHNEMQQLFCVDDQQLVCMLCVALDHRDHNFCSIRKAAHDCKEVLKSSQEVLQALLVTVDDFKSTCENITKHIETEQTEKQIREEFEKLHKFLRDEEEARITALREEEEQKTKRMTENIAEADREHHRVVQLIQEIEDLMEAEEDDFLQNYHSVNTRVRPFMDFMDPYSDGIFQKKNPPCHQAQVVQNWFEEHPGELWTARSTDMSPIKAFQYSDCYEHTDQCSASLTSNTSQLIQVWLFPSRPPRAQHKTAEPQLDPGALIDVAKHLGNLKYRVWEKMKDTCPYFPVILDPNTARRTLRVSEDLTSFSGGHLVEDLPENLERFTCHPVILGSEGFNSGTHSWVVEVKESADWIIGVATESVKRKEVCKPIPAEGLWTIRFRNNKYSWSNRAATTIYQKFRVQLNWDAGEVKFFSDDCLWDSHSHKHRFTEKIYPFFYCSDAKPMRILPAKVTVQSLA
ncbi:hypothetical protein NFI96_002456 [Prochilodus magdalenae]|nr:hypothetical protein NFI96_002456 [Prochilodus magdalenae]